MPGRRAGDLDVEEILDDVDDVVDDQTDALAADAEDEDRDNPALVDGGGRRAVDAQQRA